MKRYILVVALVLFASFSLSAQEEKLTPEEADSLIMKYTQQEEDLRAQLEGLDEEIAALEEEVASLEAEIARLEEKRDELKKKIEERRFYVVKPGDTLAKIAEKVYGEGNSNLWTKIYNANKDKIKDPDLLVPGWKLRIPPK